MTTATPVTETHPAPLTAQTPLASLCLSADQNTGTGLNSGNALAPCHGTLTPTRLDAPEAETSAILHGAAVHDLGWQRRISVCGEDRKRWLSGMVTNTVEGLADNSGAYNFVLNAQGRIQGDCLVWRSGDALEIELAADQQVALLTHFDHFIIMDDVELQPIEDTTALGLTGPQSERLLESLGLPAPPEWSASQGVLCPADEQGFPVQIRRGFGRLVPHYTLWVAPAHLSLLLESLRAAGATAIGAESIERLRIVEGIAAYGTDFTSLDLPQETAQTHALSFTKGCYLGQEIVERIRSRGQVHRHLRPLEIFPADGHAEPAIGTEFFSQQTGFDSAKPVSKLTSVSSITALNPAPNPAPETRFFALGVVRAEAEIGNNTLHYRSGTAKILTHPPQFRSPTEQQLIPPEMSHPTALNINPTWAEQCDDAMPETNESRP